jgi:hypothetical protein
VFFVPGVRCNECPRSYIDGPANELIQIVARTDLALQDAGGSLYGPSLVKWPSKMVDAFVTIRGSKNQFENARFEAEQNS